MKAHLVVYGLRQQHTSLIDMTEGVLGQIAAMRKERVSIEGFCGMKMAFWHRHKYKHRHKGRTTGRKLTLRPMRSPARAWAGSQAIKQPLSREQMAPERCKDIFGRGPHWQGRSRTPSAFVLAKVL